MSYNLSLSFLQKQLCAAVLLCIPFSAWSVEPYALRPLSLRKVVSLVGSQGSATRLKLSNEGSSTINDFDYRVSFGNEPADTLHHELTTPIRAGESVSIQVQIPAFAQAKGEDVKLSIVRTNGVINNLETTTVSTRAISVTQAAPRKTVVEEYTGVWCPYCPKGMVAMDCLAQLEPERCIGISIHAYSYNDPMATNVYKDLYNVHQGYPQSILNRDEGIDPYFGRGAEQSSEMPVGVYADFLLEQQRLPEAHVAVEAEWNSDSTSVDILTKTRFFYNAPTASYALAYVVVADGLSNPTWYQANKFAGHKYFLTYTPEMAPFVNGGSYVRGWTYNDVAIAGEGAKSGIRGSITTPLHADTLQTHRFTIRNVGNHSLVHDKSKLSLCVLLLDNQTNEIVNADRCSIARKVPAVTTAISAPSDLTTEATYYSIDGRRSATPHRGLNIVRQAGKSARKILK